MTYMEEVDEALLQRVCAGAVGLPHEDHIVHTFGQHNVAHPTHAVHIGIMNLHKVLKQLSTAGVEPAAAPAWRTHTKGGSVSLGIIM